MCRLNLFLHLRQYEMLSKQQSNIMNADVHTKWKWLNLESWNIIRCKWALKRNYGNSIRNFLLSSIHPMERLLNIFFSELWNWECTNMYLVFWLEIMKHLLRHFYFLRQWNRGWKLIWKSFDFEACTIKIDIWLSGKK